MPVDADGLDVAALRRHAVGAVFVTPAHQFPTGAVLAPRRRSALVDWARRSGGLVIEDDYDAEFRYDREPVGCVQGLAPDVVALVGSASKALAPGLRRGWLVVRRICGRGRAHGARRRPTSAGSVLEQLAFADLLATGGYDRHLRHARRVHRQRRDALVARAGRAPARRARSPASPPGCTWSSSCRPAPTTRRWRPGPGRPGSGPLPLSSLRLDPAGPPGLVLGYAAHAPDELTSAVRTLSTLLD